MVNTNQRQFARRYDTLSQPLKDALWSPYINSVAFESGKELGGEANAVIGILIADVLMGFSNPDDFEKNLKEDLSLDGKKAAEINEEISKKIFTPLKAEIEKNYNPVLPEETEEEEEGPTPLEMAAKEVSTASQPLKIETAEPVNFKKVSPLMKQTPSAPAAAKAEPTAPTAPKTEKLGNQPTPAAEPVKAELAPVPLEPTVIHEEQAAPLQKSINLGDFQIELSQSKRPIAAAVAAEFEMKNYAAPAPIQGTPKAPSSSRPAAPVPAQKEIPKVVHYSAYSTPLSQVQSDKVGQPKPASESGRQARQNFPSEKLGGQTNQNAFIQLGKTKLAENTPPEYPEKSAAGFPSRETSAKTGEKTTAKLINLNDFGIADGAGKNTTAAPKGPEIKGNTIDLTK